MNDEKILSAESITRELDTRFIGQRIFYYPSLTSTMEVARQKAQQGAAEGTVILTDEQTAGRGRLKRLWLSPKGSIALSIILYPGINHLPSILMLASLAVVHSIESVTGLKPQIKWPNDVLINDRKVCGILVENDLRGNTVNHTMIGIGINANLRISDFPEVVSVATSLSTELGREVSRFNLIKYLLIEVERLYLVLTAGGSVYEEWRDRLITLGRNVRVDTGEAIYEGVAESVARDGSLLIRSTNGSMTKVVAGDVTLPE